MNKKRIFTLLLPIETFALFLVVLWGIINKTEGTMAEFSSDMLSIAQEYENNLEDFEGTGTLDSTYSGINRRTRRVPLNLHHLLSL